MSTVLATFSVVVWGASVGLLFMWLVRREAARLVGSQPGRGPTAALRRRALRWAGVSGALFVPALWGPTIIPALLGFHVARVLSIRGELRRGS